MGSAEVWIDGFGLRSPIFDTTGKQLVWRRARTASVHRICAPELLDKHSHFVREFQDATCTCNPARSATHASPRQDWLSGAAVWHAFSVLSFDTRLILGIRLQRLARLHTVKRLPQTVCSTSMYKVLYDRLHLSNLYLASRPFLSLLPFACQHIRVSSP